MICTTQSTRLETPSGANGSIVVLVELQKEKQLSESLAM